MREEWGKGGRGETVEEGVSVVFRPSGFRSWYEKRNVYSLMTTSIASTNVDLPPLRLNI